MKCVLDTTVNLKRLVAKDGKKLMLPVNGKTILEHQFSAMKQAGISSVFVLIALDDSSRGDISREAIKYGYNLTFLDVDEDLIQNRRSIMATEVYLKQDFIYLPVNRLVSASLLKQMIDLKVTNHQILSAIFTGRDHPHIGKNSVFRIEYSDANSVGDISKNKDGGAATRQGYDIGVYKCSPIIFKLVDKVAQNKVFSWNRLQAVLGRAGRNMVLPTENVDWCVIENKDDIQHIEGHKAQVLVENIDLNTCDKKVFGGLYRLVMPEMIKSKLFREFGLFVFGLLFLIGSSLLLLNDWIVSLGAGVLLGTVLGLHPVLRFIYQGKAPGWYDPYILSICRAVIVLAFSIACYLKFGAALWMLASILLLGAEVYFIARPVEIGEPRLNLVIESFAIHSIMLMIASVLPVPTLSLLIFGLLAGSISITKGQHRYKEIEREREDALSHNEDESH